MIELVLQGAIERALSNIVTELVVLVLLAMLYFFKKDYEIKNDINELRGELEMSGDMSRLDKHDERLENVDDAVDDVRQSVNKIERHFVGDEDDPKNKGLLKETYELRKEVAQIRNALVSIDDRSQEIDIDIEEK